MKKKKVFVIVSGVVILLSIVGIVGYNVINYMGEKKIKDSVIQSAKDSKLQKQVSYQGDEYVYRDGLINILCLGIAKDEPMSEEVSDANSYGQSDAVYLASIDTEKKELRILAIPRESMVPVDILYVDGTYQKTETLQLCLQYAYGDGKEQSNRLTKKRVQEMLYHIPIQRTCAINFAALPVINDAVGGVKVTVEEDMSNLTSEFVKGDTIRLKGKQAIDYLRIRDINVFKSSVTRVERQERYMKAFEKQAKQAIQKNPTLPLTLYQEIKDNMYTDISFDEVTYIVTTMLETSFSEENLYTVPGEMVDGAEHEEYYVNQDALYELVLQLFYKKSA